MGQKIICPFDTRRSKMSEEKIAVLKVERRSLEELKPHPRNPRSHFKPGSPQWEALRKSLEHDYFDPLVWNQRNGMLVSGHFRCKILKALGYTSADVSVVDYDETTHLARLVAANNLLGKWEEDILSALARDLETAGLNPALAGWDEKQLAAQLDGPIVSDDTAEAVVLVSQAEEIQRERDVKLGDIYAAGDQRILCGDCTLLENWQRLLGDRQADMVWTDPPYNIDYDNIQKRRLELKKAKRGGTYAAPEKIMNDHLSDNAYANLLTTCFSTAIGFTKPGGALYVAHADSFGLITRQAIAHAGWYLAQCLIWVKNAFTLGRQDYQWQHEPILYGWKPGAAHYWQGGFAQASVIDDEEKNLSKLDKSDLIEIIQRLRNERNSTVLREPRNSANSLHPTVKPLPLVARQIWNSSRSGEVVIELFGGSGTTLLAAEQTGRRCVATELDPKFCAVILERLTRAGLKVEKIHGAVAD
jgi:DNA modification methylase